MARRPRADTPGTWHHVVNRGIAKRALFENVGDARFFLARLARQVRQGRIEVHAYCLLTTHFHLLVRSPRGEMSEAMRQVQSEYSRRFNRLQRRDGALTRGRYFSRPVHSIEYRRTLVRYIDANPVRAGLVPSGADYELGSAAAYAGRARRPWLERAWVQSKACDLAGVVTFSAAAYEAAFGTGDRHEVEELGELVEARLGRKAGEDPLETLVGNTPSDVQAWMQRKAALADGHRVGLPICGRLALRRMLDRNVEADGAWMVEDDRRTWRGAELAWHGLLHDLCGFAWAEIARVERTSPSRARRLGEVHRRLLIEDPVYARRVSAVAHSAIRRCLPS